MKDIKFTGVQVTIIMCFAMACISLLEYAFIQAGHNGTMLTVVIGAVTGLVGYVFAKRVVPDKTNPPQSGNGTSH